MPAGQSSHARPAEVRSRDCTAALAFTPRVPSGQSVGVALPSAQYVPDVQALGTALPARQKWPAGHVTHWLDTLPCVSLRNVPARHMSGAVLPAGQKCPAGQGFGAATPGGQKNPDVQSWRRERTQKEP